MPAESTNRSVAHRLLYSRHNARDDRVGPRPGGRNHEAPFQRVALRRRLLAAPWSPDRRGVQRTGRVDEREQRRREARILFPEMYSAFDNVHDFRVPAKVVGVKNVKWSADPDDMVELEKQSDGSVMITVKQAGDVTIMAKAGNLKASAELHIASATAENWDDGNERYNNGVTWKKRDKGDGGGGDDGDAGKREKGERKVDPTLSCTNCHNKGGKGGGDVEHTPMQTAGYTDQEAHHHLHRGEEAGGRGDACHDAREVVEDPQVDDDRG